MSWDTQISDSFTIPSGSVPGPGADSITLTTDLPAEIAANYSAAIVFYQGSYDRTRAVRQVKYYFLGVTHASNLSSAIDFGAVVVDNPVTTETGYINIQLNQAALVSDGFITSGHPHPSAFGTGALALYGPKILMRLAASGWFDVQPGFNGGSRGLINFQSGWNVQSSYPPTTANYAFARHLPDGTVQLQACFGTPASGMATLQQIAQLPFPSMYPPQLLIVPAAVGGGLSRVNIGATDGVIRLDLDGAITPKASSYCYVNTQWSINNV